MLLMLIIVAVLTPYLIIVPKISMLLTFNIL